eukprot:scaffold15427_cov90-Isochrysis_galbana.AAC.1
MKLGLEGRAQRQNGETRSLGTSDIGLRDDVAFVRPFPAAAAQWGCFTRPNARPEACPDGAQRRLVQRHHAWLHTAAAWRAPDRSLPQDGAQARTAARRAQEQPHAPPRWRTPPARAPGPPAVPCTSCPAPRRSGRAGSPAPSVRAQGRVEGRTAQSAAGGSGRARAAAPPAATRPLPPPQPPGRRAACAQRRPGG